MNYQETLQFLYEKLPEFSRIGEPAYKKDIHNTVALCNALNNPQLNFKSIHVAGTNGKGSVSHMLASILQEAGFKTGLYTSPHLYDFRERIKINGKLISQQDVVEFTQSMQPLIDSINPSFFEVTVAMAYDYFAQQQVDIAVIETGLGGRLDSTNIITPILSIITNIGWDHMHVLGDSLEKIAVEKAGIIKNQVPVVVGKMQEESWPVFLEKATQVNAPIELAENTHTVDHFHWEKGKLFIKVNSLKSQTLFELDLNGIYQCNNLITVLSAVEQLIRAGFSISPLALYAGLSHTKKNTGLLGRWEEIRTHPKLVLDVAHNAEGIEQVLLHLQHINFDKLHLILGMVKDKDCERVLDLLPKQAAFYFTQAHLPRAMPATVLAALATKKQMRGTTHEHVNDAIAAALQCATPNDLLVVCGSIFLVAEVDRKRWANLAL
ncbi:MAG: bifunctional folylpolyglutamate synthase/dihydrofolate synthase [Bacteroidetes bacterium]|nr:bifunctional folylpolyglutamate synthase/dihydrofolate synthase [Bacteroidota bacterium]